MKKLINKMQGKAHRQPARMRHLPLASTDKHALLTVRKRHPPNITGNHRKEIYGLETITL